MASKEQNEQANRTETDTGILLMSLEERVVGRLGEKGKGIKEYKWVVT